MKPKPGNPNCYLGFAGCNCKLDGPVFAPEKEEQVSAENITIDTVKAPERTKLWQVIAEKAGKVVATVAAGVGRDGEQGIRIEVAQDERQDVIDEGIEKHKERLVVTHSLHPDKALELAQAIENAAFAAKDGVLPNTTRSLIENCAKETFKASAPWQPIWVKSNEGDAVSTGKSAGTGKGQIATGGKVLHFNKKDLLNLSDNLRALAGLVKD